MIQRRRMKEGGGGNGRRGRKGGEKRREKCIHIEDWNVQSNMQITAAFEEGNRSKETEFMLKLIPQENFQKGLKITY